jgi:hypothetical protein
MWRHEEMFKGQPFWELINFADNEGTIGTEISKKLAADFEKMRDTIVKEAWEKWPSVDDFPTVRHENEQERNYFMKKYDQWAKAFAIASDNGAVKFH